MGSARSRNGAGSGVSGGRIAPDLASWVGADHVRGSPAGRLIIEYGDYECPYSRQAFHAIEQVEQQLGGTVRFAFRHFPLTGIHPHALAAAAAAEAAARQGRFWDMQDRKSTRLNSSHGYISYAV